MADTGAERAFTETGAELPFNANELQVLENEGIFRSAPSTGRRKVSARLLIPSDSDSYGSPSSSSSGASSASLRLQRFDSPFAAKDIDLPIDQESVDALEFMGFNQATAQYIYERWATRSDGYPYGFVEHAAGKFANRAQGNTSHAEFMSMAGLKQEFQDAILHPQFVDVFETETLKYWIKDTLASRYHSIACLQRRCRNLASSVGKSRGHKKKKSRPGLPIFDQGQAGPSNVPMQDPPESLSISTIIKDMNFPEARVRIGAPAAPLNDHEILFNGRGAHHADLVSLIEPDGSINLTSMSTPPGGDFNAKSLASYWSQQKETAERYRAYAEERDEYAETWIVSIQVPQNLIATLNKMSLWYSADWKEYVWYCRRADVTIPSKFDELSNAQLIEGHVCGRPQVHRISRANVQRNIDESWRMTYKRDNETKYSTQHVFLGNDSIALLAAAIRGKLHIDVYASSIARED